jgi:hypothetical protein
MLVDVIAAGMLYERDMYQQERERRASYRPIALDTKDRARITYCRESGTNTQQSLLQSQTAASRWFITGPPHSKQLRPRPQRRRPLQMEWLSHTSGREQSGLS